MLEECVEPWRTYASCLARADVVWQTILVVGVTHEDGGLDGSKGSAGQSGTSTTAEGVVHDLATLVIVSVWHCSFGK